MRTAGSGASGRRATRRTISGCSTPSGSSSGRATGSAGPATGRRRRPASANRRNPRSLTAERRRPSGRISATLDRSLREDGAEWERVQRERVEAGPATPAGQKPGPRLLHVSLPSDDGAAGDGAISTTSRDHAARAEARPFRRGLFGYRPCKCSERGPPLACVPAVAAERAEGCRNVHDRSPRARDRSHRPAYRKLARQGAQVLPRDTGSGVRPA